VLDRVRFLMNKADMEKSFEKERGFYENLA
jgi:hypothetical protein